MYCKCLPCANGSTFFICDDERMRNERERPWRIPDNEPSQNAGGLSGGLQAQLIGTPHGLLEHGAAIAFDDCTERMHSDVIYNENTGALQLSGQCAFYVAWWVAVDGSEQFKAMEFAACIHEKPIAMAAAPLMTTQLCGSAFIPPLQEDALLSIRNVSGNTIRYAATSIQAGLVVMSFAHFA